MRKPTILLLAAALLSLAAAPAAAQPLDILVFGATGKIGSLAVDEALARGHRVIAVSRDPSQISVQHENLSVERGDLLDRDSIRSLIPDVDVVIVSVRGVIGDARTAENSLQYIAVGNLVSVLRGLTRPRPGLIHVGGAGSLETESGELYADRLPRLFLPKKLEAEIDGQVLALELLRDATDIDWTYATPPRNLTNGDRTGQYRIGGDRMIEDRHGRSRISRADFAVALIDEAETRAHTGRRFAVAY